MNQPFVGPTAALPIDPYLPKQPTFETWCVGWAAYDVPRISHILHPDNDQISWEQAGGFRHLATLLLNHHSAVRARRDQLASAWQGPAAEVFLSKVDAFSKSLLSDSYCASATASALDSIMSIYVNAQRQIQRLHEHWNRVTTDWLPEWWDDAAATLNGEAQNLMFSVDEAVRDHRTRITIPNEYFSLRFSTSSVDEGPMPANHSPGEAQTATMVPPVPGYQPILYPGGSRGRAASGEGLAGQPAYVPAVPGQPISMLPIPPGNAYVPYGGAYILPGPGIGPGGYVVPMPYRGIGGAPGRPTPFVSATSAGMSSHMMPMAIGLPHQNTSEGSHRVLYKRSDVAWTVKTGVPPIIEAPDEDAYIPDQPSPKQEAAFLDWFTEVAHPWQTNQEAKTTGPRIVFRSVER